MDPVRFENEAVSGSAETAIFSAAGFQGFEVLEFGWAISRGFSLGGVGLFRSQFFSRVSTYGNSGFSPSERRNPFIFGVAEEFRAV